MRYPLLLVLLFTTAAGYTQTYPVTLRTVETGGPLPFVNVQVQGTTQGGTTDGRGELSLDLPEGSYEILASYVGYGTVTRTLTVPTDEILVLTLEATGEQLTTVTVNANDLRDRLDQPILGVERLSMTEIEALPVALGEVDVLRGLQLSSGVNSAGEASNGLSVRGGTVDQNLILLDGAPVFTPTHLFGLFSVFTPDAVGGVDLYRANIPARFGGRVSSVLDVRSQTPSSDKFKLRGGIGLVSSHLGVETPLTKDKRLKLLAAGRAGFNDFAFKLIERLKNTRSTFYDATLRLRFTANERNIFSYSAFYSKDFYQVNLINSFNGILSDGNQSDYYTFNNTFDWFRVVSANTSLQLRIAASDHEPKVIFPQRDTDEKVTFRSRIRYLSGQLSVDHRSGEDHHLSGGLQAVRYDLTPGDLDPGGLTAVSAVKLPTEQAGELSAFVEDEWKLGSRLTISTGLRYTHYVQLGPGEQRIYVPGADPSNETLLNTQTYGRGQVMQSYGGLEPRLALNLAMTPTLSLKGAYARSRQYLQNIYNATTPLPSSRWKASDNVIRPQRADLYSTGLFWLPGAGRYGYSVEAYYRRTTDLLEYRPGADFFLARTVETDLLQGTGKSYGLEVSLRRKEGKVTGEVNYAYARTFNRVAGNSLSASVNRGEWYPGYFDQPHTGNLNVTLDDGVTHRLGFNLVVQSNRPYTIPNGFIDIGRLSVPLFLERNNARLPLYHRLDFSWTIHNPRMIKKRWVGDWTFTVYNLYGRKNAYNIYYLPRGAGSPSQIFGSSPLGSYRLTIFGAPIVSLSYNFKFE